MIDWVITGIVVLTAVGDIVVYLQLRREIAALRGRLDVLDFIDVNGSRP